MGGHIAAMRFADKCGIAEAVYGRRLSKAEMRRGICIAKIERWRFLQWRAQIEARETST